jgi:histidinol-phosphatase
VGCDQNLQIIFSAKHHKGGAPALHRRWWAAAGQGAFAGTSLTRAQRISVSGVDDVADASLSFSSIAGWRERGAIREFLQLTSDVWRVRGFGDFWSYMLVAEGAVDIAGEPELATYDMAALIPVIREAGGVATGFDGSDAIEFGGLVTTNGVLHAEVLSALNA